MTCERKHLSIVYFLSNICSKNFQNPLCMSKL